MAGLVVDLELRPESITAILDDTLNLLNSNLLKNKIEVIRSYKDNPVISVDKNQLKQAFLNLFLNSIQAMPNGGVLTVTTSMPNSDNPLKTVIPSEPHFKSSESRDLDPSTTSAEKTSADSARDDRCGSLLITISDTGSGIPKNQLAHVFDPFFTTKESGTGLGLSIVHGIITNHGGKVKVKSELKMGTTFEIFLS